LFPFAGYIPDGMTPEQYRKMKQQEKEAKDKNVCGSSARSARYQQLSQLLDLQQLVDRVVRVVGWLDDLAVTLVLQQQYLPNPQGLELQFHGWHQRLHHCGCIHLYQNPKNRQYPRVLMFDLKQRGSEIRTISFSLRSIIARFLLTHGFCIFFLISS
jgi:hypothetical protein